MTFPDFQRQMVLCGIILLYSTFTDSYRILRIPEQDFVNCVQPQALLLRS